MKDTIDAQSFIDGSLELQTSIYKFVRYCKNLAEELEAGMDFKQEGTKGAGYTAIIQEYLPNIFTSTNETINLDSNIKILFNLLQNGFFDDSPYMYGQVHVLCKKLTVFSKKDFSLELQESLEKGFIVQENTTLLDPTKSEKIQIDVKNKYNESLEGFIVFINILKVIAPDLSYIYDGKTKNIHPLFQRRYLTFQKLVEQYRKWELEKLRENHKIVSRGTQNKTLDGINNFYGKLSTLSLGEQILEFGIHVMKNGEFDGINDENEVFSSLGILAAKFGTVYTNQVKDYVTQLDEPENLDWFQENLSMNIWELVNELEGEEYGTLSDTLSIILESLQVEGFKVSQELGDTKDETKKVYTLFSELLRKNLIKEKALKDIMLKLCFQYFKEHDPIQENVLGEFIRSKKTQAKIKELQDDSESLLERIDNFYQFLKVISKNKPDLYIEFEGELIPNPKYGIYISNMDELISQVNGLQQKELEQKHILGKQAFYNQISGELDEMTLNITYDEDIFMKAYLLGTHLLSFGILDDYALKSDMRQILLNLSPRSSERYEDIIAKYTFKDEVDEFSGEVEGYIYNILDAIDNGEEDTVLQTHIDGFLIFLESNGLLMPKEILISENLGDLIYRSLAYILLQGIIEDKNMQSEVGQFCVMYFENSQCDTESLVLDYMRGIQLGPKNG
ncbi:hypothetical protein GW846_01495 [Candidatus Gracilibacteria bacterium]|nr:hypothetical protein [Candidatus Gracilibacteria bacterium]